MAIKVEMKDALFKELRAKIGHLKDAHVKVGVLQAQGNQTAEDGETTLAELAAIHEFGAPRAGIPARSFLRQTFADEEGHTALSKFLTRIATGVVKDRIEPRDGLEQLGMWAVAQIKKRIKAHIPPPLQPETIKRKLSKYGAGGSTPLVATGQLLNSITSEVQS